MSRRPTIDRGGRRPEDRPLPPWAFVGALVEVFAPPYQKQPARIVRVDPSRSQVVVTFAALDRPIPFELRISIAWVKPLYDTPPGV